MELKNFKKLLEKAAHSSGDGTFDVFMKAATEANYLIQFYMPGKDAITWSDKNLYRYSKSKQLDVEVPLSIR
jgi:hypothetical protein